MELEEEITTWLTLLPSKDLSLEDLDTLKRLIFNHDHRIRAIFTCYRRNKNGAELHHSLTALANSMKAKEQLRTSSSKVESQDEDEEDEYEVSSKMTSNWLLGLLFRQEARKKPTFFYGFCSRIIHFVTSRIYATYGWLKEDSMSEILEIIRFHVFETLFLLLLAYTCKHCLRLRPYLKWLLDN
jgi:hypothetical protein